MGAVKDVGKKITKPISTAVKQVKNVAAPVVKPVAGAINQAVIKPGRVLARQTGKEVASIGRGAVKSVPKAITKPIVTASKQLKSIPSEAIGQVKGMLKTGAGQLKSALKSIPGGPKPKTAPPSEPYVAYRGKRGADPFEGKVPERDKGGGRTWGGKG